MGWSLTAGAAVSNAPYTPPSDDTVLEQIVRDSTANADLLRLRRDLESRPGDAVAAAAFARRAIAIGTEESDPRYFGYAQSALAPWWNETAPPVDIRLLRAGILQWQHRFTPAIADLDAIVAGGGAAAEQARLTRASLELVGGDPIASLKDCAALIGRVEAVIAAACIGAANAQLGHAAAAEASLTLAIGQSRGAGDSASAWANTTLADIALQLGDQPAADRAFDAALAAMRRSKHRDPYLLAAYADNLLDQGRDADVVGLLSGLTRIDNLLLRLAIAEARLGAAGDARQAQSSRLHTGELQRRFAETRERGDFVHQREAAMLLLELADDADAALQAAKDNWGVQKELIDARILLQAARAAHSPRDATPVKEWLDRNHIEDRRLTPLLDVR